MKCLAPEVDKVTPDFRDARTHAGTDTRMESHGLSQYSELRWTRDSSCQSISAENTDSDLGAELHTRTRLGSMLTPASKPGALHPVLINWIWNPGTKWGALTVRMAKIWYFQLFSSQLFSRWRRGGLFFAYYKPVSGSYRYQPKCIVAEFFFSNSTPKIKKF